MGAASPKAALAGKSVWESGGARLDLIGDMRLRLESDSDSTKDKDRTRERIRLRFGAGYTANENVAMGFRLSTASDSLQTPHQTLALDDGGGRNGDFGIDRAFLKVSGGGFYAWGGKNGMPMWNPAEFVWDADIQPEGLAAGYKTKLKGVSLGLAAGHFLLNEASFGDDDTLLAYQATAGLGDGLRVRLAVGGVSVTDSDEGAEGAAGVPGQSHNITHVMGEVQAADIPLKPRAGLLYASSDVEDSVIGAGAEAPDKNALVAYVRATAGRFDLRFYYWDAGYAAFPGLGRYAQDNFPYSSNFTGYHAQIGVKLLEDISMDLRYYNQSVKNGDITVWNSGVAMEGDGHDRSRIQLNLNVKL